MNNTQRPKGSTFTVTAFLDTGLQTYYTLQNINALSSRHLMFWNQTTNAWQTLSVLNQLAEVPSNLGWYTTTLSHALMSPLTDDLFAVTVRETTTNFVDTSTFRFGDSIDTLISGIAAYLIPARKEVSRITDQHLRVTAFDALTAGNQILRLDITHDPSGAQPEETQTNTTGQP